MAGGCHSLVVGGHLPWPSSPMRAPATDESPSEGAAPAGLWDAPSASPEGCVLSDDHGDPNLSPGRGFPARPCTSKVSLACSFLREPSPHQDEFSIFRAAACMSRFPREDFGILGSF